jgi:hypothetical protein
VVDGIIGYQTGKKPSDTFSLFTPPHLEPKKRLKRPDARVGVWWKGCRKRPPKAPFSAAFSQVQRLIRLIYSIKPKEVHYLELNYFLHTVVSAATQLLLTGCEMGVFPFAAGGLG